MEAVDPTFADLMGSDGDAVMDQDYSTVHVLRHIGVDDKVSLDFIASVADPSNTFIKVFGRVGIVAEAHKQRRILDVKGLDAFDIRTMKPDDTPWDFNNKSVRKEARRIADETKPKWIIGSPPCPPWCILNFGLHYHKMDRTKVETMMAEGRRHLCFVASLYRHQVVTGIISFMNIP